MPETLVRMMPFATGSDKAADHPPRPHVAPTTPESFETHGAPVDPESGIPTTWDGLLAFVISQVFSPVIVAAVIVLWTASRAANANAWTWAGIYLGVALLLPIIYLLILMRLGWVTDLDVQVRAQRIRPLRFALATGMAAWIILLLGDAPSTLVALAGAFWVMLAINFVVTLRWKISLHTAFTAAGTTVAWAIAGLYAPLVVGIPLMAWSRVRLGRHTLGQTIAGGLLGLIVFVAAHSLTAG